MIPIDGIIQALRYTGDSERLYIKNKFRGADGTQKQGVAPTVTLYNTSGAAIISDQVLTVDGSTSWWYIDVDTSSTSSYPKGVHYRAVASFTDQATSTAHKQEIWFDVALWPLNDPAITSEEIDADNPMWASMRPEGWDTWERAINHAHREIHRHLRKITDKDGEIVYPFMVLGEEEIKQVSLALAEHFITRKIHKLSVDRKEYAETASMALKALSPLLIDKDSDRVIDDDEEKGTTLPSTILTR